MFTFFSFSFFPVFFSVFFFVHPGVFFTAFGCFESLAGIYDPRFGPFGVDNASPTREA